jgi:gamma-glutamyltranspeptidase/glutathione hydrolase
LIERPAVCVPSAAAATSHPLATEAALHALRLGGSAVDAAVAAGAVLCVVEPWASHLGGDAFALVWDQGVGRARAIQGSGPAPRRLPSAVGPDGGAIPIRGPLPTTVPGMIGAWCHLLDTRGRLPRGEVFAAALALAREGFPAGGTWELAGRRERAVVEADPGLATLFGTRDQPVRAGDWIRQTDLARAIEGCAREGAAYFHGGPLGEAVVRAVADRGGSLSIEDLRAPAVEETDAVARESHGVTILEQPPVSQGAMVLAMLGILEEADRQGWSFDGEDDRAVAQECHLQIEAYHHVAAERDRWLCDPRFATGEQRERVERWTAVEFAREALGSLDRHRARPRLPASAAGVPSTTYLCTADADGNAVSWIQSIFHPFGSGWIVPGTGCLLNNRMTGFSTDPSSPNRLEPGKRTVHTLNTWMALRDGRPWLVGGTPGGEKQVQTNAQILRGRLARGRSLAASIHAPRWAIDEQGRVALEARFPRAVRRSLENRGHPVVRIGPWGGSGLVQALERLPSGGWMACTDPRGEGMAGGF